MSLETVNERSHGRRRTRRALVLGGGGLLGAMFQIGVLAALEEADLSRTCWRSLASWFVRSPARVLARLREERRQGGQLLHDLTAAMLEAAPSGLLTLDPLIEFLAGTLRDLGLEDRFDALPQQLVVPAIDLDWGERVVFGAPGQRSAAVSSAVAASCAIPQWFRPVTIGDRDLIDGGIADLLNLDLALRPGVREILAIHAVVAPINDGQQRCLPSPDGERAAQRYLASRSPAEIA